MFTLETIYIHAYEGEHEVGEGCMSYRFKHVLYYIV